MLEVLHPRHPGPPRSLVLPLLLALAPACADDLKATAGPTDGGRDVPPVSSMRAGEVVTTAIDGTNSEGWVYFDFETESEARAPQAADQRDWDLAFQRFKVKSNGGVSGTAGVEVAVIEGKTLDEVTAAPAMGWLVDQADGDDGNPDPDTAFNRGMDTWFEYDTAFHSLSPRKRIYVVRTGAEGFFAVQMVSYYDEAGDPGFLRLRWKRLPAPTGRVPATPGAGGDAAVSEGGNVDAGAG